MLSRIGIPGLFITGTDTGVGKTIIAGAIAAALRRGDRPRVAVCKLAATGCVHRREGLVSEDAEFLAHCADADFPLDTICPQRYAEPLAPAVAADRARQRLDWTEIDRAIQWMTKSSDVIVVEGIGGIRVPMDDHHTVLDAADWLRLPTVVVARPDLGTINHTLLTLDALRSRNLPIAGVVINRYPTDTPDAAQETNPRAIERWGKTTILCVVPDEPIPPRPSSQAIPPGIAAAIGAVDWSALAARAR